MQLRVQHVLLPLAYVILITLPVLLLKKFNIINGSLFIIDILILQFFVGRIGSKLLIVSLIALFSLLSYIDRIAEAYHFDLIPFLLQTNYISLDIVLGNLYLIIYGILLIGWITSISFYFSKINIPFLMIFILIIISADRYNGTSAALNAKHDTETLISGDIASSIINRISLQINELNREKIATSSLLTSDSAWKHYESLNSDHSVILVVVESLGLLTQGEKGDLLNGDLQLPDTLQIIEKGVVPSHGSTVSGELRELCGLAIDQPRILDTYDNCFVHRLRAKGYYTLAAHSYRKDFFSRSTWWPQVGFNDTFFMNDMVNKLPTCKGAFLAVCDIDLLKFSLNYINVNQKKPFLLYFLTSNTHSPLPTGQVLEDRLRQAVDSIIKRYELYLKETGHKTVDLVIVGDHPPPTFGKAAQKFRTGLVPWWIIKAK